MQSFDVRKLTGWKQDTVGIRQTAAEVGSIRQVARGLVGGERRDAYLFLPLLACKPSWRRGAQGIGDCFLGSALVTMADGSLKRIDQVQVGDLVLSANNTPRRVTRLIHKDPAPREMITVKTRSGLKPFTATIDHQVPILDIEGNESWRAIGTVKIDESLVLGWGIDEASTKAEVYDLAKFAVDPTTEDEVWGQYQEGLGRGGRRRKPVQKGQVREKGSKAVNRWVTMDERLAWLLGLFAAEGSTDMSVSNGMPTRISFNLGSHRRKHADQACRFLNEIFGTEVEVTTIPSKPSVLNVRVSNRLVATFFRHFVDGNVYSKSFHKSLFVMPKNLRLALIRGWLDGDGYIGNSNQGIGLTSSPLLAMDVRRLLLSIGAQFRSSTRPACEKRREAYEVTIPSHSMYEIYPDWDVPETGREDGTVQLKTKRTIHSKKLTTTATGMASKVVDIERFVYEGPVYCLEVEHDHTFIADGYQAHNCVSWGAELAATLLMANDAIAGTGSWIEEAATESIYGGCRVEALGKTRGGRSDGAFGYAAAKWLKEWGVTLRIDYSKDTGNKEHDLRKYNAKKAKEWGDFGCGGSADKGKLDAVAKLHPVEHIAQVKTVEEAIAALSNYYPVTIASMAGFGDMKRNADGLCFWVNQWAHQMCLIAIRWRNGKPEFRVGQSWGDSCSGPDPGIAELLPKTAGNDGASLELPCYATNRSDFIRRLILPDEAFPYHVESAAEWNAISACSWWIDERTLARILQTGDCWSIAGVKGFEPRKLNVKKAVYDRLGLAV